MPVQDAIKSNRLDHLIDNPFLPSDALSSIIDTQYEEAKQRIEDVFNDVNKSRRELLDAINDEIKVSEGLNWSREHLNIWLHRFISFLVGLFKREDPLHKALVDIKSELETIHKVARRKKAVVKKLAKTKRKLIKNVTEKRLNTTQTMHTLFGILTDDGIRELDTASKMYLQAQLIEQLCHHKTPSLEHEHMTAFADAKDFHAHRDNVWRATKLLEQMTSDIQKSRSQPKEILDLHDQLAYQVHYAHAKLWFDYFKLHFDFNTTQGVYTAKRILKLIENGVDPLQFIAAGTIDRYYIQASGESIKELPLMRAQFSGTLHDGTTINLSSTYQLRAREVFLSQIQQFLKFQALNKRFTADIESDFMKHGFESSWKDSSVRELLATAKKSERTSEKPPYYVQLATEALDKLARQIHQAIAKDYECASENLSKYAHDYLKAHLTDFLATQFHYDEKTNPLLLADYTLARAHLIEQIPALMSYLLSADELRDEISRDSHESSDKDTILNFYRSLKQSPAYMLYERANELNPKPTALKAALKAKSAKVKNLT